MVVVATVPTNRLRVVPLQRGTREGRQWKLQLVRPPALLCLDVRRLVDGQAIGSAGFAHSNEIEPPKEQAQNANVAVDQNDATTSPPWFVFAALSPIEGDTSNEEVPVGDVADVAHRATSISVTTSRSASAVAAAGRAACSTQPLSVARAYGAGHSYVTHPRTDRAFGGAGLGGDLVVRESFRAQSAAFPTEGIASSAAEGLGRAGDAGEPGGEAVVADVTDDGANFSKGLALPTKQAGTSNTALVFGHGDDSADEIRRKRRIRPQATLPNLRLRRLRLRR